MIWYDKRMKAQNTGPSIHKCPFDTTIKMATFFQTIFLLNYCIQAPSPANFMHTESFSSCKMKCVHCSLSRLQVIPNLACIDKVPSILRVKVFNRIQTVIFFSVYQMKVKSRFTLG